VSTLWSRSGAHLRGTPYASGAAEFRWPVAAQSVRLARGVVQALCRVVRLPAVCDDAALVDVETAVRNSRDRLSQGGPMRTYQG
jgi:hypothetical protein